MPFTTAGLNAATGGVTAAARFIALHTADPGSTGAAEVAGGKYARQATTWAAPNNGASTGTPVVVDVPASTTVTHWGVYANATGGTPLFSGPLPAPEAFGSAGTLTHTPTITSSN